MQKSFSPSEVTIEAKVNEEDSKEVVAGSSRFFKVALQNESIVHAALRVFHVALNSYQVKK